MLICVRYALRVHILASTVSIYQWQLYRSHTMGCSFLSLKIESFDSSWSRVLNTVVSARHLQCTDSILEKERFIIKLLNPRWVHVQDKRRRWKQTINMEQCTVYSTTGINSICLHKNTTTDFSTNQTVVFISIVWFGCCYCYWWWHQPVAGVGRGSTTTDAVALTISSIPNNTQSFHATDKSTNRKYWNRSKNPMNFFACFMELFHIVF